MLTDADASLVAHASSKAVRVICARRCTNHFSAGDTERALVCAEACLSGEDASEVMEATEAPALFLCVARGDAQGAAGFLDDLASQCAVRLASCAVWAPARCRVPHLEQRRGDGAPCLQSASRMEVRTIV